MALARAFVGVRGVGGAARRALCSAESISADPIDAYREHPRSHYRFPASGVEFSVGQHFARGGPAPVLKHSMHNDEIPGIHHITPWAKAAFCYFGEGGNIGKKTQFTKSPDGVISDPLEAQHELTLVSEAFGDAAGANEVMLEYCGWLEEIREKYVEHLVENYYSYPVLQKKFGDLVTDGDTALLTKLVNSIVHNPVKYAKAEDGVSEDRTRPMLPFRQKLYYKGNSSKLANAKIRSPRDAEMAQRGYLRKHVALYERDGTEVPLQDVQLYSGSVISVESRLLCTLYDVGGNVGGSLKRNMYSVVRLQESQSGTYTAHSPFEDYNL